MTTMRVDSTDRRILRYLLVDARRSIAALARKLGLSESAIRHRLSRLTEHEVIRRFTVDLDYDKIGYPITVIVGVKLGGKSGLKAANQLQAIDGVVDIFTVTGEFDLFIRIVCATIQCFEEIIEKIRAQAFIANTRSFVVINKIQVSNYDDIIEITPKK